MLHVEESGPLSAPLVVLVHGSMDRSTSMAKAARRLEADHRVVRYDRRGYARSAGVGPPFDIEAQVDDLVGLLAGRPAALVGHSYGGVVALAVAARHPALVTAVGVYEPPLAWRPEWPAGTAGGTAVADAERGTDTGDAAERFMRRMVGDRVWERLPEATRVQRRAEGAALVGELADLRRTAPFDPEAVRCPVLVARGERGAAHHAMGADLLASWFGAEVAVVVTAGHGVHTSHPVEFAAFARRVVAAGLGAPRTLDHAAATAELDAFEGLVRRRRTSLVLDPSEPVPDALVERLVTLATWAPNHKRTWPWRFAHCTGEARAALGEAFALDQAAAGVLDAAKLAKTRGKYLRAPSILVVGAADHEQEAMRVEQRDAVAAGLQNLLLGATAAGLASFWSSPPAGVAPAVLDLLGWPRGTQLVAVVYLGWPTGDVPVPARPPAAVVRLR